MAKKGRPRRADTTVKLTTRLNETRRQKLHRLAFIKEISIGKLIEEWIDSQPEPSPAGGAK